MATRKKSKAAEEEKKVEPVAEPSDKKVTTFTLKLTRNELTHLRDLMSVTLPGTDSTVSQALAALENRPIVEQKLWSKIAKTAGEAGLPLDVEAPDYIVIAVEQPKMSVLQLAHDPIVMPDHPAD